MREQNSGADAVCQSEAATLGEFARLNEAGGGCMSVGNLELLEQLHIAARLKRKWMWRLFGQR